MRISGMRSGVKAAFFNSPEVFRLHGSSFEKEMNARSPIAY